MLHRANVLVTLLVCLFAGLLNAGMINAAYAEQKPAPHNITGKVTEIIAASGYTYAEVDTGKNKVWAAGPVTPIKVGDMIAFSSEMPMENFHSKSMQRDFSTIYFVNNFITDKSTLAGKATATTSPHGQIKQQQDVKAINGINKVEGGYTIAETYSQKADLNGKTILVRGLVTKFTSNVMGKNWLHIRDSSTMDDLTITTQSTAAIDDVVVIEGKLGLDKDFSYGYVYPLIVEDAKITKE